MGEAVADSGASRLDIRRRLLAIEELALCGTMPRRRKSILSNSNVKRLEEIMKRSHLFHRRALIRYWFALAATGLIVGAAPNVDSAAKALATSAVAQADDERPKATDAVQERIFSGPQPGEKIKPFKVLHAKADQPKELESRKSTNVPLSSASCTGSVMMIGFSSVWDWWISTLHGIRN
jgi:hypothetical protein